MSVDIKWACALGVLVVIAWGAQHRMRLAASSTPNTKSVVVVELFTSEGCSSCPPADEVLSQIAHRQRVMDVEVLALGEHVDYWDRFRWRDPFSSAMYSERQSNYDARVFHRHEVYTPQLVIDGRLERVGSDVDGIRRAIAQAADAPKASVNVSAARRGDRELNVNVHVDVPPALTLRESVDVLVAVTEDKLASEVRRGENRGRTLKHSAVLRSLTPVGTLLPHERTWSASVFVPLLAEWKPVNVLVMGFLQERESRRIVGAGAASGSSQAVTR